MPPTVILIRHAQALHNVDNTYPLYQLSPLPATNTPPQDYQLHDPDLSALGREQCNALRDKLHSQYGDVAPEDIAVIVSPMRRTLQTALSGLGWLLDKGVKFEADADWQENSDKPCDTGSPIPALVDEFPTVDFSTLDPVYPDKTSPDGRPYAYTRDAILSRGERCIDRLFQRPEKFVFVVSHSGFLRLGVVGWWFFNSDFRIFNFDGTRLWQDESTLKGGLGLSFTDRVVLGSELPVEDPGHEPGEAAYAA
ncbi:hypothetical protein G7046_g5663 [Stylonectria norvegica]|nr:hypothetical protein G7046_g5663 [Stylonectria norvegica]